MTSPPTYDRMMFAWVGWADLPSEEEIARLQEVFTEYTSRRRQKTIRELRDLISGGEPGPGQAGAFTQQFRARVMATQIRLEFLREVVDEGNKPHVCRGELAGRYGLTKKRIQDITQVKKSRLLTVTKLK